MRATFTALLELAGYLNGFLKCLTVIVSSVVTLKPSEFLDVEIISFCSYISKCNGPLMSLEFTFGFNKMGHRLILPTK